MKKQSSHWWQNAFPFSSSSNNTKSTSDDTLVGARYFLRPFFFTNRGARNIRQAGRAKKVSHLADTDVASFDNSPARFVSSSSASPKGASPQPLPLPELQNLIRHDAKSAPGHPNSNKVPLPSPRDAQPRHSAVDEKEKEKEKPESLNRMVNNDGATTSNSVVRLIGQDAQQNLDHPDTWLPRKSPKQNGFDRVPISAPASPYSSAALSPRKSTGDAITPQYLTPPSIFQVWSAPEMPSSDPTLGHGFSYPIYSEIASYSADNTPLPSFSFSKCSNGPASPLANKLSVEVSLGRRDNNAQANVHPLPLPPGAVIPSPRSPLPLLTAKVDIIPIRSQWQKGKLIGRGTFGSVYVASNIETGALCAMKEVEMLPDDPKSAECIRQLEQEIKVLSQLKHPNIVQYYGSEIVGDRFYIFLEYVHPGSINKFIRDHCGAITESVVRNFTRHILCGLAYLHNTKTIHRDIKGANLLVDAYGVVKLADFGMAKHLNGHVANLSLKGSPYWMAPELLQSVMQEDSSADLALAVDIWSLGCTIIEMFNGQPPWSEYEGAAAMFKVLKETPPIPENLSAEGKDFLCRCFQRNPAERASASMLLEHRFVRNSHPPDVSSGTQSPIGMKMRDCPTERKWPKEN